MEIRIKQRLIGCLVLLTIILTILLPLLFYNPCPLTSLLESKKVISVSPVPTKSVIQLQFHPSPSAKITARETHLISLSPPPNQLIQSQLVALMKLQPLLHPPVTERERAILTVPSSVPGIIKPKKISWKHWKQKFYPAQLLLSTAPLAVWIIQVASFSNSDNAKRFLNQLRSKGFDVCSYQNKGKKTIIRVFVGPIINRNKIDQIQKQLKQQLQLNGVVKKYVIL